MCILTESDKISNIVAYTTLKFTFCLWSWRVSQYFQYFRVSVDFNKNSQSNQIFVSKQKSAKIQIKNQNTKKNTFSAIFAVYRLWNG